MKKTLLHLILIILFAGYFTIPISANFSDVESTHPNFNAVEYLQKIHIISGYSDGTFKPMNPINRAEFLKIVIEAAYPKSALDAVHTDNSFSDVAQDSWYAKYVSIAVKDEIVSGYPDHTFKPENTINLSEAVKIIVEAFHIPQPVYIRAPDHWYEPYMSAADSHDLFVHLPMMQAGNVITRGTMAQMVYNTLSPMTTYSNASLGFSLQYSENAFIDPNTDKKRVRIENYQQSDLRYLKDGEYYLEVALNDLKDITGTCTESVVEPTQVKVGKYTGYLGFGQPGGDAGGTRHLLCVETTDTRYYFMMTVGEHTDIMKDRIFDSVIID